jgi:hypothetical protein
MAKLVLTDVFVEVAGVDLSARVDSVTLNFGPALVESSAFGSSSVRRLAGVKDWSVDLQFQQDFAAGQVDATLSGPALAGTAVTVELRPTTAARSATNPAYRGSAFIESYTPLGGAHGELSRAPVALKGDDTLSRLTA